MKFRFTYDGYQEVFIQIIQSTDIIHRVRKDKTIEYSAKWHNKIDDVLIEFRFDILNDPVVHHEVNEDTYLQYIHKLAEKNIPFIIEKHDAEIRIVTDTSDTLAKNGILRELGYFDFSR